MAIVKRMVIKMLRVLDILLVSVFPNFIDENAKNAIEIVSGKTRYTKYDGSRPLCMVSIDETSEVAISSVLMRKALLLGVNFTLESSENEIMNIINPNALIRYAIDFGRKNSNRPREDKKSKAARSV